MGLAKKAYTAHHMGHPVPTAVLAMLGHGARPPAPVLLGDGLPGALAARAMNETLNPAPAPDPPPPPVPDAPRRELDAFAAEWGVDGTTAAFSPGQKVVYRPGKNLGNGWTGRAEAFDA